MCDTENMETIESYNNFLIAADEESVLEERQFIINLNRIVSYRGYETFKSFMKVCRNVTCSSSKYFEEIKTPKYFRDTNDKLCCIITTHNMLVRFLDTSNLLFYLYPTGVEIICGQLKVPDDEIPDNCRYNLKRTYYGIIKVRETPLPQGAFVDWLTTLSNHPEYPLSDFGIDAENDDNLPCTMSGVINFFKTTPNLTTVFEVAKEEYRKIQPNNAAIEQQIGLINNPEHEGSPIPHLIAYSSQLKQLWYHYKMEESIFMNFQQVMQEAQRLRKTADLFFNSACSVERKCTYVILRHPPSSIPLSYMWFYQNVLCVGKGKHSRAVDHPKRAFSGNIVNGDCSDDIVLYKRIREEWVNGNSVAVVFFNDLTDDQSLEYEALLLDALVAEHGYSFFGCAENNDEVE